MIASWVEYLKRNLTCLVSHYTVRKCITLQKSLKCNNKFNMTWVLSHILSQRTIRPVQSMHECIKWALGKYKIHIAETHLGVENRQPAFIYFIKLQIGARSGHKILATCLNILRQLLQGCKNEKLITITDWLFSSSWLYLEQDILMSWQSRKY